jgi:transcriptional regulator with XRE-family HTH domain
MEGELQRIVGANIRQLRRRRGMSQEQFADTVGVHRTYLGGVERGERNLSLQSIERIAEGAPGGGRGRAAARPRRAVPDDQS